MLPAAGPRTVCISWQGRKRTVGISVSQAVLNDDDRHHILQHVAWMFRAGESFVDFWRKCADHPVLSACVRLRAGALVRSASVFEDVVKTLCTTNCHWRNTKVMLTRLCQTFGTPVPQPEGSNLPTHTFPTSRILANATTGQLSYCGLGFRARFVKAFAACVANGTLDCEGWRLRDDADAIREELLSISGIGQYAAAHVMMLLGHYGSIPCDSDVIAYVGLRRGVRPCAAEHLLQKRFAQWGEHAFLAYKFERMLRGENYVDY